MKRTLSMTAILAGLIMSPGAQAALSAQCEEVLALPAVSPYVSRVLYRIEAGLQYSKQAEVDPLFQLWPWTRYAASAIVENIDERSTFIEQADSLTRSTACLHFDTLLLQCKLEAVRQEMRAQLQRGSFTGIMKVAALLSFAQDRIAQLHLGANDKNYQDPTWGKSYIFDPPTQIVCCDSVDPVCKPRTNTECTARSGYSFQTEDACVAWGCQRNDQQYDIQAEMCPYHSDYAPPFLNGYGCDLDVLDPRASFAPIAAERDSLKVVMGQLDAYRDSAQQFLTIQQQIAQLTHQTSALPPPPEPRTHLTAMGCRWDGGLCANNPAIRCTTSAECNGSSCVRPQRICERNRNIACFASSDCRTGNLDFGSCIEDDGNAPATIALRDPFHLMQNTQSLISTFGAQRTEQGASRRFPEYLLLSQEKNTSTPTTVGAVSLSDLLKTSMRDLYRGWSEQQGAREAHIITQSTDAELQVAHGLDFLRSAIEELATLAVNKESGLRSFVIRFASFLRRSCTERPCNASLEQILKISMEDECFPYTNGDFLDDTKDDPRWKKCADAAGIQVP